MNKLDKTPILTPEEFREGKAGYIYAPYIMKSRSTDINGITVWHSNKLINFWLRVKFFFWKPKAIKNFEKYATKPINTKYYGTFKINKDEQTR
jgi:hypothetical protein